MNAFILGIDCSSTAIGWCLYNGIVIDHGVIQLPDKAPIGRRCVVAHDALERILDQHAIDALAIESPVARFAKAVIPQSRVSGVLLELAERRGILAHEVTPQAAKLALADDGAATKREMLIAAASYFGYDPNALIYRCQREKWTAWISGCAAPEYGEDAADALGVALAAACVVRVELVL